MHSRSRLPVLVPSEYLGEIGKLSKAALMDMVWSLAGQTCESAEDNQEVIDRIRREWNIIKRHRIEEYATR